MIETIKKYFPEITSKQEEQLAALDGLYREWNAKINVISRKDIDNICVHHVLHSLGILKAVNFRDGSSIMDLGTGGGFPGIPMAIMLPECKFHLVDSIGKKIRVATEVANAIGLTNISLSHDNAMNIRGHYDFVVSRAVMTADKLARIVRKNVVPQRRSDPMGSIVLLKGGNIEEEMPTTMKFVSQTWNLSDFFEEDFFETKKVVKIELV